MADDVGIEFPGLSDIKKGLESVGDVVAEGKAIYAQGEEILGSIGIDLGATTEKRTADGGWVINGKTYQASAELVPGLGITNGALPNWFPFGAVAVQWEVWKAMSAAISGAKREEIDRINPALCAWYLVQLVKAQATEAQIKELATFTGAEGLRMTDPARMTIAQLRQYWIGLLLVASIRANAPAFNELEGSLRAMWSGSPDLCRYGTTPDPTDPAELAKRRAAGWCVGVFSADGIPRAIQDSDGRIVSPGPGEVLPRAVAMLAYMKTGETMQETLAGGGAVGGSFAGFESCVRSGDSSCLSAYTPASPDFWAALREPWRFGYNPAKKVQIVQNTFGRFLAWDLWGKPRGVSVSVAVAIGLPTVIAIGTIAALTFLAKSKIK